MKTKLTAIKKDAEVSAAVVLKSITMGAKPIQKKLTDIKVETHEDFILAGELLKDLKNKRKLAEEKKKAITEPLMKALQEVRSLFSPFEKLVDALEKEVKDKMLIWYNETERNKQKLIKAYEDDKPIDKLIKKPIDNSSQYSQARTKKVYHYDLNLIPKKYLMPDEHKIKSAITAGLTVPGVTVTEEKILAV